MGFALFRLQVLVGAQPRFGHNDSGEWASVRINPEFVDT